jgi:predicted Zn-dependent protease
MRLLDASESAEEVRAKRAKQSAALDRKARKARGKDAARRKKAAAAAPVAGGDQQASGRVYLVPLDGFPVSRARKLAAQVGRKLDVRVTVARGARIPSSAYNAKRKQIVGDAVTRLVLRRSKLLTEPSTTLIGLTTRDMFILGEQWKFAFSLRDGQVAVISSARMDPRFYGLPADDGLAFERLRKMTIKDTAIVHFGDLASDDPRSVLYGEILGTAELDFMTEDIEPRESAAQQRWIRRADAVCTDWQVAALVFTAKTGRMTTTSQVYAFLQKAVPLNERFARRFLRLRPARSDRRLHGRLVSELRAMLREDRNALRSLSPQSSKEQFGQAFASSIRRNVVMQSLALRLGSEACGIFFDPAPVIPKS